MFPNQPDRSMAGQIYMKKMKKLKSIVGAGSGLSSGALSLLVLALASGAVTGCIGSKAKKPDQGFFTSGSREADQRASQRMAKAEQMAGSGEGAGEKETKGAGGSGPPKAQAKQTLFERLGGEQGIAAIVDDFTARALQDPRVNWQRKGVTTARLFHHNQAVNWTSTEQNVATFKEHLVQFISLATGGPAQYQGKGMKEAHGNMHITNPEFDAAVGDLKAALDKAQVPNKEQKELLAIVESTRPQIVTER